MDGKIIIAGATGYTGAALARSFAKDDIRCHLIGRNEEELKKILIEVGILENKPFAEIEFSNIEDIIENKIKPFYYIRFFKICG